MMARRIAGFAQRLPGRTAAGRCLALCLVAIGAASAMADAGGVTLLPIGRGRATTPYLVAIDTKWCDVNGYRPVRVEVRRRVAGGRRAERTVEVRISPYQWGYYDNQESVVQKITIPEGAMSATATIYIWQDRALSGCQVTVTEGGRDIRELANQSVRINNNNSNRPLSDGAPSILVLDYDAPPLADRDAILQRMKNASDSDPSSVGHALPNLRPLMDQIPNEFSYAGTYTQWDDVRVLEDIADWPRVLLLTPPELPDRWLALSGMDLVFITWSDLQRLADEHPAQWQRLLGWALAGGNLAITEVGEAYAALGTLESVLGLEPLDSDLEGDAETSGTDAQATATSSPPETPDGDEPAVDYRNWRLPRISMYGRPVSHFERSRMEIQGEYLEDGDARLQGTPVSTEELRKVRSQTRPFITRALGYGRVTAFAADPFPGTTANWRWFFNDGGPSYMWYRRHGMSLRRDNSDYWDFMIPDVGVAPVNAFRLLITLFVVVIGPVNFLVLKRLRRLGWMMVTVPAGAGCVVLALFLYALYTDGIHVQYRIRSLSHIDQRRGHIVNWSRQAYYAGMAPSQGFHFPRDAAVYPLDQVTNGGGNGGREATRREIAWESDQHLRSGYVASRVTSQFMVVRSRSTQRGLQITAGSAEQPPRVVNRLGTEIQELLLCDEGGQTYVANGVEMDAPAELTLVVPDVLTARLEKWFQQAPLARPAAFDEASFRNAVAMNSRYYYGYSYNSGDANLPDPSQQSSVLERQLTHIRRQWAKSSSPRTYVALVAADPETPRGVSGGKPKACFSVIYGSW